jgi:2-methylaconitate cis-trans-isomerase PrpF
VTDSRPVEVAIMRGGTSRGPTLSLGVAPPAGAGRDIFARSLIGDGPTDGLGGGSPTTSKIVLVGGSGDGEAHLDYIVGNLTPSGGPVDWSGTCGNMTAAVVPYAAMTGLLDRREGDGSFRLRNLATDGLVDVTVADPASLGVVGAEVHLTTAYLDPGGAVLGNTFPTGNPRDVITVDGEEFDCTLIDVTHPYLLLDHDAVVRDGDVAEEAVAERIERIRGSACVMLGLCDDPVEAAEVCAAIPRVVLVHADPGPGADVRITAVSMGESISTVPVTAAMSLAAARRIAGTLVSAAGAADLGTPVRIAAPAATLHAGATVDAAGDVMSAWVHRTARCLMRGIAWV